MTKPGEQTAPRAADLATSPISILVIDDDQVDRERVRRFLPKAGIDAELVEEADPNAALEMLGRLAPAVVVLDYAFPRHDGLSVLRRIRQQDALTPVIVMTGHDETALAVELMKAGAVDYIPKAALTPQRLGQSVRHALRLRASELSARAARDALRASEEFSRGVLDSSHDFISVLDIEGRLLSLNPAGQRMLAVRDGASLGEGFWLELWHHEHRRAAEAAISGARAGELGRFVGCCSSRDGNALWCDVQVTPILGPLGRTERLLAVCRDVTEQRRRADFEQQLIAIVSHDLRNPISAMIMAGTLLVRKLPADSPLRPTASRVVRSGNRAARLIRDLLDFAQVRFTGSLPVEPAEVDIHMLCRQAAEEIASNDPVRELIHSPEGDGLGTWDSDRIAQVIGNLLRNAVNYSPPDSPIHLRSQDRGSQVRIEVHNQGEPIPAAVIPTLFEPFKRGDRKVEAERSVGLGLFIVREIVTAHGGSVRVHSTREEGTTFVVELPKSRV